MFETTSTLQPAWFRRLLRGSRGSVLPMVAAALIPLLAMLGGSIDMGRSYLAQSRLQQACDAGVLAARKRLGTEPAGGGDIPADVAQVGNKFFNVNFQDGSYGTRNRSFSLALGSDYSLAGEAKVDVPTTVMRLFGQDNVAISVACSAQIGMTNTDILMVLDVTGSMNETNAGDSKPKIQLLKDTIGSFYAQMSGASPAGTRVRYGFVPYSTNVNVGGLLQDDWVTKSWKYQSRKLFGTGTASGTTSYWATGSPISGTADRATQSTYTATKVSGNYTCAALPAGARTANSIKNGTTTEPFPGPPVGTITRVNYTYSYNGYDFAEALNGATCTLYKTTYKNWVISYDYVTQPTLAKRSKWQYAQLTYDVSNWRTDSTGCIEERKTEMLSRDDLLNGNVDLDKAMDLDLDRVPTSGDSDTQWRPHYPKLIYGRALKWDGSGAFSPNPVTTSDEYFAPHYSYTATCPPPARKLGEMSADQLNGYLATLKVGGSTYHDIGMIWGGRLVSPTGLFALENADASANQPTSRNLIFLTDGQTSTLDISYTAYGLEPIDQRRWKQGSADSLTSLVEARFAFTCSEVKKKNINVWVIAFGTELNPVMADCAGPGHSFQANTGDELAGVFAKIAGSISNLRITR